MPPASAFCIDAKGWCAAARRQPSPNHDARAAGVAIDLLVVHNISLPPGVFGGACIEDLFCNRLDCSADPYFAQLRGLQVSAHFLVRRDGSLLQFVSTLERAWHAGISCFDGHQRCNDFSVGIELEGSDFVPFAPAQYVTLAALTCALQVRHGLRNVVGHEHIAAGRKTDPGPYFDWNRYRVDYLAAVCAMPQGDAALRFFGADDPA